MDNQSEMMPLEPLAQPASQSSATHLQNWEQSIKEVTTKFSGVIKNITLPDKLNGDLTLEQIDTRWASLQGTINKKTILEFYESLRDYLILPHVTDIFPDSPDGHHQRRKFRRKFENNQRLFDAVMANDLRLVPISGVLGIAQAFALLTSDSGVASDLEEQHINLHNRIVDKADP